MIIAVVPVKSLASAKSRLAPYLDDHARRELVLAMLRDVLAALTRVPALASVWVIACDAEVGRTASSFGAEWLAEERSIGYNQAVAGAAERMRSRSATAMLVIPGDIPGLATQEVSAMLGALPRAHAAAVLVPSHDGQGTNAALLAPPTAFPLRFGEPSFGRHCHAARLAGVATAILRLPGASLDLDTPDDLALFLRRTEPSQTGALLERLAASFDATREPARALEPVTG